MKYIDLHVHSNMSDGTLSPTEVVELAAKKGLEAIALTDHDTTRGVAEALKAAHRLTEAGTPIKVIPGAELSASYKGKDIHILGLYLDYKDPELIKRLDAAVAERDTRNEKMCKNLQAAGIDITLDKLRADCPDTVITRAHFGKYLHDHHYTKSVKDAFTRYLGDNTPYYVPRNYLNLKEAVDLIKNAGGIPVLAHPLLYKLPKEELNSVIEELKAYGLKGIETFYSCNIGCDESDVRRLARIHNLVMTGGSDFHGTNKPDIDLGTGRGNLKIPATILDDLEKIR
ncbi:predicted metal-dependent phosphoesterase [Lachnospiraceae bacterium KM106-2]|nr:predicted metal-dependent phosphoesterase [Lachnospiraceae bacterium KM106-2]